MLGKGSKIYSVVHSKCPRCHEGDFFENKNPYALRTMGKHKERCAVCGQKFEIETGFFFGAMILNYVCGVIIFVAIWLMFMFLFPQVPLHWRVFTMCSAIILAFPFTFHLTRLIWINAFVKYDPTVAKKS